LQVNRQRKFQHKAFITIVQMTCGQEAAHLDLAGGEGEYKQGN